MQYLLMLLAVAGATALDQLTKILTVENIPLHGQVDVIPHTNYIRAEVIDDQGRKAWTNPIFLEWEE